MMGTAFDPEKYAALTALVRESRAADKAAFVEMEAAKARWKSANEMLTERMKVLDGYLAQVKSEDTRADA